ncbi:MAG: hypothetical protein DYH12_02980 [Sorangiineae bacterium PRO1]|nr:hypothetical protein [Sorangiineae bacterium PRO1]
MSDTPPFDRRVPDALLSALAGPFGDLRPGPHSHPALDLQLRSLGRPTDVDTCWAAHATLYIGHAQVITLHIDEQCRFSLSGQKGEGADSPFKGIYEDLFDPRWEDPQPDRLADLSRSRTAFIDAIVSAARPEQIGKEGALQAALSRWPDKDFVVIDRESIPPGLTDAERRAALAPVEQALLDLQESGDPWTFTRRPRDAPLPPGGRRKNFGTELDALAIDSRGRLLVMEAKHASDTTGVGWTPAQVAVYLRLFRARAARHPEQLAIVNEMLGQRQRLGLAPADSVQLTPPLQMVPVIVIGGELGTSAKAANNRTPLVLDALDRAGEPLEDLELWQVAEADYGRAGTIRRRSPKRREPADLGGTCRYRLGRSPHRARGSGSGAC